MSNSLSRWVADADALMHMTYFRVEQLSLDHSHISLRLADYYIALVGDLFSMLSEGNADGPSWARLGNALGQFDTEALAPSAAVEGISLQETALFSAAAYYCGGFPASAYLSVRRISTEALKDESALACYDMLARPREIYSRTIAALHAAMRAGDNGTLSLIYAEVVSRVSAALESGPEEWVTAKLLEKMVARFSATNVRSVLPGGYSQFWTPLVESFLDRIPPTWDFFPSQIAAINAGLLQSNATFSLQMPTGSGKTTLCETLLYTHSRLYRDSVSVLVVPYRSLASELRTSLVKHLNAIGLRARCAYGGTVPSSDEVHGLEETRVMVATPESLSGLLSADPEFFRRISLVICDEGHLLDGGGRGVGLELLLARMRARSSGAPRFVFVSAIVPNIEEINAWLGGTDDSVVRSDYRPAIAEFAALITLGSGAAATVNLVMHAHEQAPVQFTIHQFLKRSDFVTRNPRTGRSNTYSYSSVKAIAVAAARKALPMGTVAVFAANKRGAQGCIGVAEELLKQLRVDLALPKPVDAVQQSAVRPVVEYLAAEFGDAWIGTETLKAGAVVHHGDIPQETRELLEALLRKNEVKFVICTSTLAEGVNLPIRTLVLYSIERVLPGGIRQPMLARDIKNLVGRAGRAGSNTKGLVICANPRQWPSVSAVANQSTGEPVRGSLRELMTRLRDELAKVNRAPTNELLETAPRYFPLLDGIDMTLLDLAAEEIGDARLATIAIELANRTFAASQATEDSKQLLRKVFELRATRVNAVRSAGRLDWVRSTGARVRLLDSVERDLLPRRASWTDITAPTDSGFVSNMLDWTWTLPEVLKELRDAFQLERTDDTQEARQHISDVVATWLGGQRFVEMAQRSGLEIDMLLGVHTQVVAFALQTAIEQGIALLQKLLESQGKVLSAAAMMLPDHLRYGAPTRVACVLAGLGVRHRRAYVQLGQALEAVGVSPSNVSIVKQAADQSLRTFGQQWQLELGELVYENTLIDLK